MVLPVASMLTASWPPVWLLVWFGGTYLWAFATLFVPRLRCLGGGHLYVFNTAAVGACYVAWLPGTPAAVGILGISVLLTAVSLLMAWRIVRARPAARDEMFDQAVVALSASPRGRVAVFPLQSAEAVAWATHHAVLWGAHGYGFSHLRGFFPVLTQPVSTFLRQYRINWMLYDDRFWPCGSDALRREGIDVGSERSFGHWRLAECLLPSESRLDARGA